MLREDPHLCGQTVAPPQKHMNKLTTNKTSRIESPSWLALGTRLVYALYWRRCFDRTGTITNQLVEPRRGSLKVRFAAGKAGELRDLAMRHLSEMRRLLAKPENIGEARAVLAERVGSFTLSPALEWSCAAKGSSGFSSACISLSAFRRRRSTRVGAWTSNCWAGSLRLLPPPR